MTVRFEIHDQVALHHARPSRARSTRWTSTRCSELRAHLVEVRDRDDLRVAILTGAGTRAFCAGADLKGTQDIVRAAMPKRCSARPTAAAELGLYIRLMDLGDLCVWKPLIAAVNGHCLGAGLELALQCDMRIASTNASFGLPEAAVGSIPAVSGLHRLLKAVPSAHAMQMALTGERIDAAHGAAHRPGVRSRRKPQRCCDRAFALAQRIAGNAPLAVQADQEAVAPDSAPERSRRAAAHRAVLGRAARHRRTASKAAAAFAEKRAPRYVGR